jgi:glycine/sarcosine N-methyltransferase
MIESTDNTVAEFYNKLASNYDTMTGFEKRFAAEEPYFRELVRRFSIASAVDAGCGTGFHALLLARLGVDVTGIDISSEMLKRATKHAREMGLKARFVESPFQQIASHVDTMFDGVFCLGNSLAHILSKDDLLASIRGFASVLKARGRLFLQILNYDRIMVQRNRIQNMKEEGDSIFVRFYDFESELIRFNVLKLHRSPDGFQHELNSVQLRPVLNVELCDLLGHAGFGEISTYGNVRLEEFDDKGSQDLFMIAAKR